MKKELIGNLTRILVFLIFGLFLPRQKVEGAVSTCGAKMTGSSGTFTSPDYPNIPQLPKKNKDFTSQSTHLTCEWKVIVPPGKGIQLQFGHFDMNAPAFPDDCDKGEVQVFSGLGKEKSLLDEFCPENTPSTVTVSNNSATVVFRRPPSFTGTGFLISYIAIVPNELIDDFITCTELGQINKNVESFSVVCPKGCGNIKSHKVYGKLPYREDNTHLCRAAVHAGVISDEFGGRVNAKRKSGNSLFYKSNANNISSKTGSMGTFKIDFPDAHICRERIPLKPNQFSASSYINTTENGRIYSWTPQKAVLGGLRAAWAPKTSDKRQWLQVDLGKVMNITGIITTGSERPYSGTKKFTIKFSFNNITWYSYKETDHIYSKVFYAEQLYSETRNNFVVPTIVARHLRVYPFVPKNPRILTGLRLGLTGCDVDGSSKPLPQPNITEKTTMTLTTSLLHSKPPILVKTTSIITNHVTTSKAIDSVAVGAPKEITIQKPTGTTTKAPATDLNEKTIFIIAIVAALSVISILLAALVLFLVRKRIFRSKDSNQHTAVPKGRSQNNATYTSAFGINYNNNNNNKSKKKSVKTDGSSGLDFLNVNYKETFNVVDNRSDNSYLNSRGGITLQYNRDHLDDNEEMLRRSSLPARSVHSAGIKENGGQSVENKFYDGSSRDGDEHEYQVILDPIKDSRDLDQSSSSKLSITSIGDSWSKDERRGRRAFSSFSPPDQRNTSRTLKAETFPHAVHYLAKEEELEPFVTSQESMFTKDSKKRTKENRFQSNSSFSEANFQNSKHRHSSSSSGSSDQYLKPLTTFLPPSNLPLKKNERIQPSDAYDPIFLSSENYLGKKPSYKVPTSAPFTDEGRLSATYNNNNNSFDNNFLSTFSNGSTKKTTTRPNSSRSESFNQARIRNGYDHLYKGKTLSSSHGNSAVDALPPSDYNQLRLNPPA